MIAVGIKSIPSLMIMLRINVHRLYVPHLALEPATDIHCHLSPNIAGYVMISALSINV